MKTYHKRIADDVLKGKLEASGLVLIEGTKWCGKTTTAEQQSASVIYLNDPSHKDTYLQLAQTEPKILLEGATPHLVDEWQDAVELWDTARFEIDHRDKSVGQFIFTGSTVVKDEKLKLIKHSGAGRVSRMRMRPMSTYEFEESSGSVSLAELFAGNINPAYPAKEMDLRQIAYLICRGGWPAALSMSKTAALQQADNYIDAIVNTDISSIDDVRRDPVFARKLLRSLARAQGSQTSVSTIYSDIRANESSSLKEDTIYSYIGALRKLFVTEDSLAWNPNLRSKTAIRTMDTRYFVDPSIAAAALGIGPEDLISDLNTMGLLFETLCIRDLRVYADALKGDVYHYRDKNGLECDAVIHLRNGRYGLVEIKLGGNALISEGVRTLTRLASLIDTERMKAPSFLMVLTGTGSFAYRDPSGVLIAPIGTLKP